MCRIDWQEYFMILAKMVALRSTCISRPIGAVLVKDRNILATGYNGAMVGRDHCIDDGICFRRGMKIADRNKSDYCRAVHAEANTVAQAAKNGISVKDSVLYTTLQPCYFCLKLIVNSGVKEIYYEQDYESVNINRDRHWRMEIDKSNIKVYKLDLSNESIQKVIRCVKSDTSKRKLKSE